MVLLPLCTKYSYIDRTDEQGKMLKKSSFSFTLPEKEDCSLSNGRIQISHYQATMNHVQTIAFFHLSRS